MKICIISKIGKNGKTASNYKGVVRHKDYPNKWLASCRKNNIVYRLGFYDTEKEAAIAYNNKVKELYDGFATLNIIEEET